MSMHRVGLRRFVIPVALVVLLVPILPEPASGHAVVVESEDLPSALSWPAGAWGDGATYLFGGCGPCPTDRILRHDPYQETVQTMRARLPTERERASAVFDGERFYVFGGVHWPGYIPQTIREIVEYDPDSDAVRVRAARLPQGLAGASAVWAGDAAYIFGGSLCAPGTCATTAILRYDPALERVETVAHFPQPVAYSAAVWTGQHALIFGGMQSTYGSEGAAIWRFDPATNTVSREASNLPSARAGASAAWDGRAAYVFGGILRDTWDTSEIVRYDPASGAVATMPVRLPTASALHLAVWAGDHAIVYGGAHGVFNRLDDIVGLYMGPAPPGGLSAFERPLEGSIEVSWNAPAAGTVHGAVTYRLDRAFDFRPWASLAVTSETAYVDATCPLATQCWYRVAAVDDHGLGARSGDVWAIGTDRPAIVG